MTQATTVNGPVNTTLSTSVITVGSGAATITGNNDTVLAAAGTSVELLGTGNFISVTTANVTITAAASSSGAVATDNMVFSGNYGTITDGAFNSGYVTISGSNDFMGSAQSIETMNLVVSGNADTVSSLYLNGSVVVSGNNAYIEIGSAAVTISGTNDTVVSTNASSILVSGSGDKVINQSQVGEPFPFSMLFGPSTANTSVVGTLISITGANANVSTYNNNDTISSSGNADTVAAESYVNSLISTGNSSSIMAAPVDQSITVSGANTTVTTSYLSGATSTLPGATVDFTGAGTVGSTYNEGALTVNDTVGATAPVTVNLDTKNVTVYAGQNYTYTDSIGGNQFTLVGGAYVDVSAGNDTVTLPENYYFPKDTVGGGTASAPNTLVMTGGDFYLGNAGSVLSTHNVLDVNGNNNTGMIYAANQDTVNINGSGNFFSISQAPASLGGASTVGTAVTVNGASTLNLFTGGNTVVASDGASLYISGGANVVTGNNVSVNAMGAGNKMVLTGTSSVVDASPFTYAGGVGAGDSQNFFTVQSGSFNLGGLDQLVQSSGTAAVSLYGGNAVTLNGSADSVNVSDQIYGGNTIVDNGSGTSYTVNGISGSAVTISAAGTATVRAIDMIGAGARVGGPNYNTDESVTFLSHGTGDDYISARGTSMAVLFSGGVGSADTVYGGLAGGNSLVGGAGYGDLFVAGGNGDVLTGGSRGANTLVSGAGSETLTGASLGTDLFSITGGGSSLVINGTAGKMELAAGLTVTSETTAGGGLTMLLNDGTQINFTGITSLTQTGSVFTL